MLIAIDRARPGTRDAVRALVPPQSLEIIDEAAASSWLDAENHHWLVDGTIAVLGVEQAVASWRAGLSAVFQRPLHRFYVEAAMRLFLHEPGRILRLIPGGWALAYRDFCTVSYQGTGAQEAEIRFDDVAPQAFISPGYLHSWHAICQGIFDLEKPVDGRTSLDIDLIHSRAVVRFSWGMADEKSSAPERKES